MRLNEELKVSSSAFFVTLTYDDAHLPTNDEGVSSVSKRDVQLFIKRLRKKFPEDRIRYFLVSEYGPKTGRPHYHAIIFNLPIDNSPCFVRTKKVIQETWNQGYVDVGSVTAKSISYVAKYCLAYNEWPKEDPFGGRSCFARVIQELAAALSQERCPDTALKPGQIRLSTMEVTDNSHVTIERNFWMTNCVNNLGRNEKSKVSRIIFGIAETLNTNEKYSKRTSSYERELK